MKPYLLSLGAGILVGLIYALLDIRSPAPPLIALVGLLGIFAGEQLGPLVKRVATANLLTSSAAIRQCQPEVFGNQSNAEERAPLDGGCRGAMSSAEGKTE